MKKAAYIGSKLPDQPNLPSITESSVSVAAEREEAFCSTPSFSVLEHGGFLHQLLLKTPAPVKETSARLQLQPSPPTTTTTTPWSGGLRWACAAAAACVVIGSAGAGDVMAVDARRGAAPADGDIVAVGARAPPRWSDRRECPPWSANSLENIAPENLPRPSERRRFNSVEAPERAPALAPEAVAPFLALHSGLGCFSLQARQVAHSVA